MPKLPDIKIKRVDNRPTNKEFLKVNQDWYELTYPDGSKSVPFQYDAIKRWINDAAVILAYSDSGDIYLRSCVRPPMSYIDVELVNMWELAAGLIDPGETPIEAAARECKEELGFDVPISEFRALGDYILPSAGMSAERLYLFCVMVDPQKGNVPLLDGSPLEKFGEVIAVPNKEVRELIRNGYIKDAKTEIAIRRFFDTVAVF
jgi:ADP-ribose pyrophosphatase